ncbi:small ribosomal subunit protein mS39-like isoform X3 [Symsagittifera roscoffensis]|uniref:small ribosomal subunit protein mS39-like isoform X3 n=1 Tax=Symsagittifera roscoffensis TaxID=84072 RepID=UPI00307BF83D
MIMISATSRLKLPALKSSLIFDRYKYRFVLCQLTTYSKTSTRCCSAAVPGSEVSPERPQIPHKIKRGPTELLEALASTVGTDPTGHGYQYIDDPYLLPYTEKDREDCMAAHAFGEAAADMVFRNMPQLFHMDTAIPRVEAFYPHPIQIEMKGGIEKLNQMGWSDDMVYEGDKIDRIAAGYSLDEKIEYFVFTQKVEEAVEFYNALSDEQKLALSDRSKSQLFALLAYFGNVDRKPTPDPVRLTSTLRQAEKMDPEEDLLAKIDEMKSQVNETGNMEKDCLARTVFESIEQKTTENYATIIKSLVKYGKQNEAFDLFQKQLAENMQFDVHVYNIILSCWTQSTNFGRSYDKFVVHVLSLMRDNNVVPDCNTFVEVLRNIPDVDSCEKLLLPTMKEVEVLGIQPSLALYAVFIRLGLLTRTRKYRELSASGANVRSVRFEVLYATVEKALSNYSGVFLDQSTSKDMPNADTFDFLPAAINLAIQKKDPNLAERLFRFAQRNPFLLKFQEDRAEFFKKYIQTIASCDDPREWNRLLFNIVPTAFTPSVGIIVRDIVPSLVGKGAFFCLPKLWEVLKLTGYAEKSQIALNEFCTLLGQCESQHVNDTERIRLADEIIEVIDVANFSIGRFQRNPTVCLNSQVLKCLLTTYTDCKDVKRSSEIFLTGMRLLSSAGILSFEKILKLFWENNMIVAGEEFCRNCLDLLPLDSSKGRSIVDSFHQQYKSDVPPEVAQQYDNGLISEKDLETIKQNARLAIDRIEQHVKEKSSDASDFERN